MGYFALIQVLLPAALWYFAVTAAPTWTTPTDGDTLLVAEDDTVGTVIETLSATTATSYSIVSSTPDHGGALEIVSTSVLQLAATVDTEAVASYQVVLRATDGASQTSDITVTLSVIDVNDVSPVVTFSPAAAEVLEFSAAEMEVATISHTDGDVSPAFQTATYTITGGNTDSRFKIANTNKIVTADALIDFTTTQSFTLTITATDDEPNTGTNSIVITIKTRPVITQPPGTAVNLPETAVAGATVFTAAATNEDGGTPTFSIESQPGSEFEFDGNALKVTSGTTFDYETTQATFAVQIRASNGPYFVDKTVTITVTDANDESPVVSISPNTANVLEFSPVDTEVAIISHTDGDVSPAFQTATYTITGGNTDSRFKIANTNKIVTADALIDFTTTQSFTLTITATDDEPNTGTNSIVITIKTRPVITQPPGTAVNLPETAVAGATVFTAAATNEDGGTPTFSIESQPGSEFEFDGNALKVTSGTTFDYETTQATFAVQIRASNGPYFVDKTVTITVTDANDESPVVSISPNTANVLEFSPVDTEVAIISHTDGDVSPAFQTATYTITGGNTDSRFKIANTNKIVTADALIDFTTTQSFTLTITATDDEPNTGTNSIVITIKTRPVITQPPGTAVNLPETAVAGATVFTAAATNEDGGTPTFSIESQPGSEFEFDGNALKVTSGTTFDYETTQATFAVQIRASNGPYFVDKTVTITVTDANDESPVVSISPNTANVLEFSPVDTEVATISHTDGDVSPAFQTATYTITGGNTDSRFKIANTNKIVTADALIDFTTTQSFTLTITATDDEPNTGTNSIVITIKTRPVITQPPGTAVDLPETAVAGATVFTAAATDDDGGTPTFSIESQPGSEFEFDGNALKLASGTTFDYETTQATFAVQIRASDGAYFVDKTVTITVTNANDESPVVSISPNTANVLEFSPVDTIVATISHSDRDISTAFGLASYSITDGNNDGHFKIANTDKIMTTDTSIDFTNAQSFTLQITATDDGQNTGTSSIVITIKTRPVITQPPGTAVDLPETAVAGATVFTAAATDDDGGTPTFSIESQPGSEFEFDGNALKVTSGTTFDYETTQATFAVQIRASDGAYSVDKTVTITVTNANDESPVVSISPNTANVLEFSPVDTIVATISHSDRDISTAFGLASYSITDGNNDGHFKIANTDKIMTTDTSIDFTNAQSFTLQITATDDGQNTGTSSIVITIRTIPIFTDPSAAETVHIDETAVGGGQVKVVVVADEDTHPNVVIVSSQNPLFTMDGLTLQVATGVTFDFESGTTSFPVQLQATDGENSVTSEIITVQIDNVNEAPAFTSSANAVEISEAYTINQLVYTSAATDPESDSVTFSITGGNSADHFQITSAGVLSVKAALDPSVTRTYTLVLTVSDASLSGTLSLPITVNSRPVFTSPDPAGSTTTVAENEPSGTSVYVPGGTDRDSNAITYTILDQSVGVFQLVGSELQTAIVFDFETPASYSVTFRATDDSSFMLTSTAVLTVTVTNVNEAPVCTSSSYTADIQEGGAADAPVATVAATDVDAADAGGLAYAITAGSTVYFKVDSSGNVATKGALVYNVASSYTLTVTVTDNAGLTCSSNVVVTVKTSPTFSQPPADHTITISENTPTTTTVFVLQASDQDGDPVTFEFTNDNAEFDEVNGEIIVAGALDYETTTSYVLNFKALDPSSNSATASLTVAISDYNDLPPVFAAASYTGSALERVSTATSVVTVLATDGDSSFENNNVIQYSITGGNAGGLFTIDASSGQISASNLAYSTDTSHTLTVTAKDKNGAAGANAVTVSAAITVLTKPAFTTPPSSGTTFAIPESHPTSSSVYAPTAMDADSSGTVTYSITEQSPSTNPLKFSILDANTGVITSGAEQFDVDGPNPVTQYTLTISAGDGVYSTETELIVNINDVNDNDPEFNPTSYTETVQENLSIGSSVATVTASDVDSTSTITYSITGGNSAGKFTMVSAQINLDGALEYDTVNSYSLTVTASDGTNSVQATVTLNLKSVPTFTSLTTPGTATLTEDSTGGDSVFTLAAADADGDSLTYGIVSQTNTDQFRVQGTEVQLNIGQTLDFETNPGPFTLTFSATDPDGNSVTSNTLQVSVTDVNDNDPVFNPNTYTKAMKTGATAGTSVLQLTVSDADGTSPNNQLTFTITNGNTNNDISVSSSVLLTVANVLSAARDDTYTLTVRATDGGTSPRFDEATVTITVSDPTDVVINSPATGGTASVSVAETVAIGQTVFTVDATDPDGDVISYSIKSQSPGTHFTMSGSNLQVSTALDYETATSHTVDFYVDDVDGDSTNIKTSGVLTVTVTDVNDFPRFSQQRHNVNIREWQHQVTNVLQVTASNAETSQTLTYSIVAGDPLRKFTVDNTTGQIATTISGLSRAYKSFHLLAVQAVDNGNPPRADSTHVMVSVTAFNAGNQLTSSPYLFPLFFVVSCLTWKRFESMRIHTA